MQYKSHQRNAK